MTFLDCGHEPTRVEGSAGAGFGRGTDGKTRCYSCCNAEEREALLTGDRYDAYLSGDGLTLTTWPGGKLADVTRLVKARTGGFGWQQHHRYYFRAIDVHGAAWYGSTPGKGMFARMHRAKGKVRP